LGIFATIITALLKGKIKPHYHPSVDTGDYIVLNADSIILNGNSKHYLVSNPGRPGHSLKNKKRI
jgi:ribosomal protein L13